MNLAMRGVPAAKVSVASAGVNDLRVRRAEVIETLERSPDRSIYLLRLHASHPIGSRVDYGGHCFSCRIALEGDPDPAPVSCYHPDDE